MPNKSKAAEAAQTTSSPEVAPKIEKQLYYRIKKINGYLAEILEVEIDEKSVVPKVVSKQDSWHLLLDKVTQLVYPSADEIARRKREATKVIAAEAAAKIKS